MEDWSKSDEKEWGPVFYKCGHGRKVIIMDSNILAMATYLGWKDDTGFDGDCTECWPCYCKRNIHPTQMEVDK